MHSQIFCVIISSLFNLNVIIKAKIENNLQNNGSFCEPNQKERK